MKVNETTTIPDIRVMIYLKKSQIPKDMSNSIHCMIGETKNTD